MLASCVPCVGVQAALEGLPGSEQLSGHAKGRLPEGGGGGGGRVRVRKRGDRLGTSCTVLRPDSKTCS